MDIEEKTKDNSGEINEESPVEAKADDESTPLEKGRSFFWIIALIVVVTILSGAAQLGYSQLERFVSEGKTEMKIGFITDWEYGYKNDVGNKLTNQADEEMEKAVKFLNEEFHPEVVISGGDMVESSLPKKPNVYKQFREINGIFSKLEAKRGYVFGNHDVRKLTKEELRNELGLMENHSYFDQGEWRFILMDTAFNADGTDMGAGYYLEGFIPESEFAWLREALDTNRPTILFSHHSPIESSKNLSNGVAVRTFLEKFPNVAAVFSGHDPNSIHAEINGVNYFIINNLVNKDALGSFASIDLKYNKNTKQAALIVRQHGAQEREYLSQKTLPQSSKEKIATNLANIFKLDWK